MWIHVKKRLIKSQCNQKTNRAHSLIFRFLMTLHVKEREETTLSDETLLLNKHQSTSSMILIFLKSQFKNSVTTLFNSKNFFCDSLKWFLISKKLSEQQSNLMSSQYSRNDSHQYWNDDQNMIWLCLKSYFCKKIKNQKWKIWFWTSLWI